MKNNRSFSVLNISFMAMMAAMVYVVTLFRFPLLGSKVHFANAVCLLSGILLGPLQGGLAAGESFPVASFSAGDLAVRRSGPNAVSRSLEAQAEAIMGPYVQDGDFAFLEVMG